MMTQVSSFKNAFKKEAPVFEAASARVTKLTKPAKVLSWTRNLSLKMYIKQLKTWNEIKAYILNYIKYQDFVENLKGNKEIKGLPQYVDEHVLPLLVKKRDQMVK